MEITKTPSFYMYFEGYLRLIYKAIKGEPRIKGSDFTKLHLKGTFIVKMAGHITCVIDGVILAPGIVVTEVFIQFGL